MTNERTPLGFNVWEALVDKLMMKGLPELEAVSIVRRAMVEADQNEAGVTDYQRKFIKNLNTPKDE